MLLVTMGPPLAALMIMSISSARSVQRGLMWSAHPRAVARTSAWAFFHAAVWWLSEDAVRGPCHATVWVAQ
jgi:hypothetical protein